MKILLRLSASLIVIYAFAGCSDEATGDTSAEQGEAFDSRNGLSEINGLNVYNGLASDNGLNVYNGLSAYNGLSSFNGLMGTAKGRTTVSYLVKCALPKGRSVAKQDQNNNWYTYQGSIGMAPQWESGACDAHCQEAVSACMMAHVNTAGIHIPLWLDSPATSIGWGRDPGYPNQEGTFFGNIFTPNPSTGRQDAFFCNGPAWAKSVVPGRLGASQPNAPYTNPFGDDMQCAGHCTPAPAPYQNDGYQACLNYKVPVTVWRSNALSFDPNKTQKICSKQSGKCLDVWLGGKDDGTAVVQWSFVSGGNQKWRISAVGGGYYKICASHSGKCLNIAGASKEDGGTLSQWTDEGGDHQRFAIQPVGAGLFSIVAKHDSKALDVPGSSMTNGAGIRQWTYTGGTNQLWTITAAP